MTMRRPSRPRRRGAQRRLVIRCSIVHAIDAAGGRDRRFGELLERSESSRSSIWISLHRLSSYLGPNSSMPLSSNKMSGAEIMTPKIGRASTRQHANSRRRDGPSQQYIHADRGKACDHCVLDHVAGKPDPCRSGRDDGVTRFRRSPGGLADLERQLRGDHSLARPRIPSVPIFAAHEQSPATALTYPARPLTPYSGCPAD